MPAIDCPNPDEIDRFVSGQLDDATIALLGEHLDSCEICRLKANTQIEHCQLAHAVRNARDDIFVNESELRRVQEAIARGFIVEPSDNIPSDLLTTVEKNSPVMPAQIGPYRLIRLLGQGGMGIVWLAKDPELDRQVALKVMKPRFASVEADRKRFVQEARATAKLTHDHIMPVYQVGEDHGIPFIAMPVLQGRTLEELLKQSARLPANQIICLGTQMAEGLKAAHEAGLIHRDIKPANIWIEPYKGDRVKILDFGLACRVEADTHLTQSGVILGTPSYMAPEQAEDSPVDHRCDLFSLGCVLYRMATGSLPFTGKDTMSILMSLATKQPLPPHQRYVDVPKELSDVIMKLLEKDPSRRPQTADEVIRLFQELPGVLYGETLDLKSPLAETHTENSIADGTVALPQKSELGKRRQTKRTIAIVATLLILLLITGTYQLVLKSKEGTLIVEVDGNADVRFKNGTLELYDDIGSLKYSLEPGVRTKKVKPGTYLVKVTGADGVKLETERFEMGKSGESRIVVTAVGSTPLVPDKDNAVGSNKVAQPNENDLQPFPEEEIKRISALPAARQIEEVRKELIRRNPNFKEPFDITYDGDSIYGLEFDCEHVTDLSPLRALLLLRDLSISNGRISDLTPLSSLKLNRLIMTDCHRVEDLSPLKGMPLTSLSLWNWNGKDLSPLKGMPLQWLNFGGNYSKVDLTQLEGLPLEHLYMNATQVSDLTPLKGFALKSLHCGDTDVTDLSPLKGMPLTVLNCIGTKVSDLSPLVGMPLQILEFSKTMVTDLSPLKDLPLKQINLDYDPLRDTQLLLSIKTLRRINDLPANQVLRPKKNAAAKAKANNRQPTIHSNHTNAQGLKFVPTES